MVWNGLELRAEYKDHDLVITYGVLVKPEAVSMGDTCQVTRSPFQLSILNFDPIKAAKLHVSWPQEKDNQEQSQSTIHFEMSDKSKQPPRNNRQTCREENYFAW